MMNLLKPTIRASALTALLGATMLIPAACNGAPKVDALLTGRCNPTEPGLALSIIRDGKVLLERTCGLASVAGKRRLKTDDVFDLASVSKQFTSMAVLILVDRGQLRLDDDVRKFFPELPVYDAKRPIRLRDLLSMTSGLEGYQDLMETYSGQSNENVLKIVAARKLRFPTGTRYEYSNTDYNLLALLVKRVSKMSFGEFVKREIFEPLGMKNSSVLEHAGQRIPGRVKGYKKGKQGWALDQDDTPGLVGDGNVFSTVRDLARWDRALRSGKLISASLFSQAMTSGRLDSGKETGYGFGWEVGVKNGKRRAWHSGSWNGTSTYIGRNLDDALSVIILSNAENLDAEDLGEKLFALLSQRS